MGVAKSLLPFGEETMLARVVRLVSEAVTPVVVVAAAGQQLPPLPEGVRIVRDQHPDQGPLEGLATGLAWLEDTACDAVYLSSCDVPLLRPALVRRMVEVLGGYQIAMPSVVGRHHPLAAVYHRDVLPHAQEMLRAGRLRLMDLVDRCETRLVGAEELADVDPELSSLTNVNRPRDYLDALAACGLTAPPEIIQALHAS
jgi:molybdopterin-guanine dinucleotide biosynthesis protein A